MDLRWKPHYTLLDCKILKLTQLLNIFGVIICPLGTTTPSESPRNSIVLVTSILNSGLPILFPLDICRMLSGLNLSPKKLHPNAYHYLVDTLALFKLKGYREMRVEKFKMFFQWKVNQGLSGSVRGPQVTLLSDSLQRASMREVNVMVVGFMPFSAH